MVQIPTSIKYINIGSGYVVIDLRSKNRFIINKGAI